MGSIAHQPSKVSDAMQVDEPIAHPLVIDKPATGVSRLTGTDEQEVDRQYNQEQLTTLLPPSQSVADKDGPRSPHKHRNGPSLASLTFNKPSGSCPTTPPTPAVKEQSPVVSTSPKAEVQDPVQADPNNEPGMVPKTSIEQPTGASGEPLEIPKTDGLKTPCCGRDSRTSEKSAPTPAPSPKRVSSLTQ